MRMTAAIPVGRSGPSFDALLDDLRAQGFDRVLFLLTEGQVKLSLHPDRVVTIVRINPEFLVEAALSESHSDWVFIFYPGERVRERNGATIREKLEESPGAAFAALMLGEITAHPYELRGFCKTVAHTGTLNICVTLSTEEKLQVPKPVQRPAFSPTIPATVVLPTWRLGGLDVTLGALAQQTAKQFEVILVDALHQWREEAIEARLKALPFSVVHVPVDDSLFPISCHSRFRNTAIRRAKGERLIFLSDYSVPPPDFIAAHVPLKREQIGTSAWVRTTIDPESISCKKLMTPWEVIAEAQRGNYLWSTFDRPAFDAALSYERRRDIVAPRFPNAINNATNLGPPEYISHWKAESVSTDLVKSINGWDETFDGRGDYADVDFTLRLLWAGAYHKLLMPEVRVLDAHAISIAPLTDITRDNWHRLWQVRERRSMRCTFGLVHGVAHDSPHGWTTDEAWTGEVNRP